MHGQPQGNINQQAAEEIITPEVALDNSAGWVMVESRKASKLRKGKAVVGADRVLDTHSPTPPTPPVCTGTGQHPPCDLLLAHPCDGNAQDPPPTVPLIIPCEGEEHNTLPLAPTTGNTIGVGNPVNVPPFEVADQCGVRTRNQKQRSRSEREFPSPAKGKEVAISADANGNTRRHKAATGMLTRSSVQRNFNMSSGSGGDSPTIPHP